jgi:hypothetical protein
MNSLSSNWPFEKLSTFLLARILEGYCHDSRRVCQALAILDGDPTDDFEELSGELQPSKPAQAVQDVVGEAIDFLPGEFPSWTDDGSESPPEPWECFVPSPADWADYCEWADRLETMRDLAGCHENPGRITDEDLMAAGLPVG